jgi:hypothetical protein
MEKERSASMKSPEAPRRIQQELSVQQIATETLVYDERRHRAYCLNESSSVIWRLADGERTVAEMREAASEELKTPVSEEFVLYALEELRRDGLMESRVDEVRTVISRRALLQRLGVGGALLLPAIASIIAPTAAQAYSGCVDCTSSTPSRAARARRLQQSRQSNPGISPIPSSPQK